MTIPTNRNLFTSRDLETNRTKNGFFQFLLYVLNLMSKLTLLSLIKHHFSTFFMIRGSMGVPLFRQFHFIDFLTSTWF